jgi:NmrA-like family
MPKQLIIVFTATGAQGFPIVEFLTTNSTAKSLYTVRALTRNTSSPTASKLAALGAQVVECSLDSDSSVTAAVQDANIIFANSDFWSVYTVEAEVAQGRRILAAAAKLPNLTHFVQSSFPDAKKISNSKFNGVLHYNAKNEINTISANEYPDLWKKTTNVWVGYYYQNWLKFNFPFGPQKVLGEDGKVTGYVQPMPYAPSTKISTVWPGDLGAVFFVIVQGEAKFHGKTVAVVGEHTRDDERLATWARGRCSKVPPQDIM